MNGRDNSNLEAWKTYQTAEEAARGFVFSMEEDILFEFGGPDGIVAAVDIRNSNGWLKPTVILKKPGYEDMVVTTAYSVPFSAEEYADAIGHALEDIGMESIELNVEYR